MKQKNLSEIIDWIGVLLILGAYAALSFGWIDATLLFQVPTLIGSAIVAIISWRRRDTQPAILNFAFAAIAMIAIIRLVILH